MSHWEITLTSKNIPVAIILQSLRISSQSKMVHLGSKLLCLCECARVSMCVGVSVCMFLSLCLCENVWVCLCLCVYVTMSVSVSMWVGVSVWACLCVSVPICVSVCTRKALSHFYRLHYRSQKQIHNTPFMWSPDNPERYTVGDYHRVRQSLRLSRRQAKRRARAQSSSVQTLQNWSDCRLPNQSFLRKFGCADSPHVKCAKLQGFYSGLHNAAFFSPSIVRVHSLPQGRRVGAVPWSTGMEPKAVLENVSICHVRGLWKPSQYNAVTQQLLRQKLLEFAGDSKLDHLPLKRNKMTIKGKSVSSRV